MKFSAVISIFTIFGVLIMVGLSEGGTVTNLTGKKGIKGTLTTNGGSTCDWMEKHYKGLDRSLKLLCDCPHGNQKYSCEYYGNPHVLGKAYVKKAPKFYVGVATFVSNQNHACDAARYTYGQNDQYSMTRQDDNIPPRCFGRKKNNRKLKQRLLNLLLKSLE